MDGSTSGSSTSVGLLDIEWQCPSCTLLNKSHTFKCRVCGTPKGTSTRQAKCHSAAIEKQYVAESLTRLQTLKNYTRPSVTTVTTPSSSTLPIPSASSITTSTLSSSSGSCSNSNGKRKRTQSKHDKASRSSAKGRKYPTLSNIDRSSGRSYSVTVDSVTVVITEYDFLYPPSD